MESTETIGGYRVHAAASIFPLISGEEFDNLAASIREMGVLSPIVVQGDILLDGRNRLRAVERLRSEGWKGDCPKIEWKDDGRNIAAWIHDVNIERRHLTEDAIALASAAVYKLIAAEAEERRKAAQFEKGKSGNPTGKQVNTNPCSPGKPVPLRDVAEMHARSTVGQVAAKANVSMHKARQAVAVQKAVESGDLSAEAVQEVMRGEKKLRDVAPKPEAKKPEPELPKHIVILRKIRDLIEVYREGDHPLDLLKDELQTHIERL